MAPKKYDGKKFYELDEESQPLKRKAESLLVDIVKGEQITSLLDIGCGDGHLLYEFPEVYNKTGLDVDESMLSQAQGLEDMLVQVDIAASSEFVSAHREYYDVVTAHYVLMQLSSDSLECALMNIYSVLKPHGRFCFTITDPRNREKIEFPGYRLVLPNDFSYESENVEFAVELKTKEGRYVDVGIRDVHLPMERFDDLLAAAGFETEVKRELEYAPGQCFALLYQVRK